MALKYISSQCRHQWSRLSSNLCNASIFNWRGPAVAGGVSHPEVPPDYYEQFPPKLYMWFVEAHKEAGCWTDGDPVNTDYALYPRRFYRTVAGFDHEKIFDYCFIGGFKTDDATQANRAWIIDFIQRHFTDESYLQFTDRRTKKDYVPMGRFDRTLLRTGFVPKEHLAEERNKFDDCYFETMARSRFTLCPAGDAFWSMRFYEALMCKSIPIVKNVNETFRSRRESELGYKFYLSTDRIKYRKDWVEQNYRIFLEYHTLDSLFD